MACLVRAILFFVVAHYERSADLLRPVIYEHLYRSCRRLDGDTGSIRDGTLQSIRSGQLGRPG